MNTGPIREILSPIFRPHSQIAALAVMLVAFVGVDPTFARQSSSADRVSTSPITFADTIAPIIYEKCSACHRPDQVGPFSLLNYDDVRRRADTIRAVVASGYMPPWKPVNHDVEYSNNRSLNEREKGNLLAWIDSGCLEGDRQHTPIPPEFPKGWMLGEPDLVVKMRGQFRIPADGPDLYRSFVFPLQLPDDRWVKAIELRPHAKSAVHHALFFLDSSGRARQLDGTDGQAGISGMGFLSDFGGTESAADPRRLIGSKLLNRSRQSSRPSNGTEADNGRVDAALARGLGGYVPGAVPNFLPGDLAMGLPMGTDIIMQTHFHPSGIEETEEAELGLYFADRPPSQQLVPIQVPAMFGFGAHIDIPPGERDYTVKDSFTLPIDVDAISVGGHAHYICRAMTMTATPPSGHEIVLLQIDDWDLDWQDRYYFSQPVRLPAGTELRSEIHYDNSAENPENPHQPPQRIRWGRQSNDEMGSITLLVVSSDESERVALQSSLREHFAQSIIARFSQGPGLGEMVLQLDENRDGKLQRLEAPPRLSGRLFELLDQNSDGGLDKDELARVRELIDLSGRVREKK